MSLTCPKGLPADVELAYRQAAEKNILAALNPKVFFGYFSVCADGIGHGNNTTFPGLDWWQIGEALLWLGREKEVLASWEYVKPFQREDGLVPFAIFPDIAGKTVPAVAPYTLTAEANGAIFKHWFPGDPLRTLANVTTLIFADAIYRHTGDKNWLAQQTAMLTRTTDWLIGQVTPEGLVGGGGFYMERPTRLEYDGINQCYTVHALRLAAQLLNAPRYQAVADRIADCFRRQFWAGDHCVEYINPEHGPISNHGLTDVDWAAIATGVASPEQVAILWPQLRDNRDLIYSGIPGGIATRPETYEDWEMQHMDRHDLSAMGRVWFLESWARWRMGDRAGIMESIRQVARVGEANGWHWYERYYSERTGDLASYRFNTYCEYPANLITIVNRFVLGA